MLLRYEWRINYGMSKNQEVKITLQKFSSSDQYNLILSNLIQLTGSVSPGLYSYHGINNYKFSTFGMERVGLVLLDNGQIQMEMETDGYG